MNRRHVLKLLAASALAGPACAAAQSAYPDRLIKWVVPYPAGGGTDNLARALAESMRPKLGQQLMIDNRPGASTNIGADLVARSKPDGYTIMSADNALLFFNEHLFKKLAFSPENDFTYVGAIGRFPLLLVVHPDFPARSLAEFLAYVRANPGKVDFASVSNGSPHHLAMELFKSRTGTDLTHVPFAGAAPAIQSLLGNHVPVMFLDLASGISYIKSGRVRALAIGTAQRSAAVPDVPTLAEQGVNDVEVFALQGVLGPAGMPAEVVALLNRQLNAALADPNVLQRFSDFGFEPLPSTPEKFKALARAESLKWGAVIRQANIVLD